MTTIEIINSLRAMRLDDEQCLSPANEHIVTDAAAALEQLTKERDELKDVVQCEQVVEPDENWAKGKLNDLQSQLTTLTQSNQRMRETLDTSINRLKALQTPAQADAIGKSEDAWHQGQPDRIYGSEWFIAVLDNGEKVVLRQLPEEYGYDFKTADETYYEAKRIKKWMQFPDSNFIPHSPTPQADAVSLRELIQYVRKNVTIEIGAHGDCQCDVPAGDAPCVYCASNHFNERTNEEGRADAIGDKEIVELKHKFEFQRNLVQQAHLAFHECFPELMHGPHDEVNIAQQIRIIKKHYESNPEV